MKSRCLILDILRSEMIRRESSRIIAKITLVLMVHWLVIHGIRERIWYAAKGIHFKIILYWKNWCDENERSPFLKHDCSFFWKGWNFRNEWLKTRNKVLPWEKQKNRKFGESFTAKRNVCSYKLVWNW